MSIEYRQTDKVSKAQKARDNADNRSLFNPSSGSAPLPNRKPVPGSLSKPPLATEEEIAAIERQWRGEEIQDVEKTEVRSANAKAGGRVVEYDSGLVRWHDGSDLANTGLEALVKGSTP